MTKAELTMIFDDGHKEVLSIEGADENQIEERVAAELAEWDPMDHNLKVFLTEGEVNWEHRHNLVQELLMACKNERSDALDLLDELADLIPRMSEDDPVAPALAETLGRVNAYRKRHGRGV